jgi:hypothetical protein
MFSVVFTWYWNVALVRPQERQERHPKSRPQEPDQEPHPKSHPKSHHAQKELAKIIPEAPEPVEDNTIGDVVD